MKMKLFGIITLLTIVIISGCIGQSPEQVTQQLALSTQTAKSFLNEYPNAEIVATYISKENVEDVISDIREKCGEQIELKDYWKVSITDPSTNLDLAIWIDAKTQQTVCAIKTGTEYIVSQPKPEQPEVVPTPTALPDLMISISDVTFSSESPGDGEIVTISVRIHNMGTATAPLVLYNAYEGTELIGYTNAPASLDPGASVTYKFAWKATAGSHTIKVTADPPNQVDEINEDNNIAERSITVIPASLPDLTISQTDITFDPSSPVAGNAVTVSLTIHNIGTATAHDVIYSVTDGETVIGYTNVPVDIPAGSDHTYSFMWRPEDVTKGDHTLRFLVDSGYQITESDETNNEVYITIIIVSPAQLPDLAISSSDITFSPASPTAGESVTINATIHNLGSAQASGIFYNIYDMTLNKMIGYNNVPLTLAAGASTTVSHMWWQNVTAGTHTIRVTLDYSDVITESDETNNIAEKNVTVS